MKQIYIPGNPVDRTMLIVAIRVGMVLGLLGTTAKETGGLALHRTAMAVSDARPDNVEQAIGGEQSYLFAPIYGYEDAATIGESVYMSLWAVNGVAASAVDKVDMAGLFITNACTGLADRIRDLPPEFGVNEVTLHAAAAIEEFVVVSDSDAAERLATMWIKKCLQNDDMRWMPPYRRETLSELVAATEGQTAH